MKKIQKLACLVLLSVCAFTQLGAQIQIEENLTDMPDSFKQVIIPTITQYKQITGWPKYESLEISDTLILPGTIIFGTGDTMFDYVGVSATHRQIRFNKFAYLLPYNVEDFKYNLRHEMFHTLAPKEWRSVTSFSLPVFSGKKTVAYCGLTIIFSDSSTFNLVEEACAERIAMNLSYPHKGKNNDYGAITLVLYNIMQQGWLTGEDLIYSQVNSDFEFFVSKIVGKPRDIVDVCDLNFVSSLFMEARLKQIAIEDIYLYRKNNKTTALR